MFIRSCLMVASEVPKTTLRFNNLLEGLTKHRTTCYTHGYIYYPEVKLIQHDLGLQANKNRHLLLIILLAYGVAQGVSYTKTVLQHRVFQGLRGYLPGTSQGPVLSLECAVYARSRSTELVICCTVVLLSSSISLLIFCLVILIVERKVLKFPNIIVDLSVYPSFYQFLFHLIIHPILQFCCLVYRYLELLSSQWIDTFVMM